VADFVGGDVVVVPFPLTDLQSSERRPAVVHTTVIPDESGRLDSNQRPLRPERRFFQADFIANSRYYVVIPCERQVSHIPRYRSVFLKKIGESGRYHGARRGLGDESTVASGDHR